MDRIASFCIDHLRLARGIYVSRKDYVGNEVLTSFDIRMKLPYREPVLGSPEIHTIEHLAATWLRNNPQWKDKIIYWGPMGCMTGNYLILAGDYTSRDIAPLITELFEYIAAFEGEIGLGERDVWPVLRLSVCTRLPTGSRSDNGSGVQAAFWGKRACFGDKRVGNVWISVPRR